MGQFIPYFHFEHPDKKLTPEWAMKVVNYCYYNNNNISLLDGKNVKEIEDFSTGNFNMNPFKKMFRSLAKLIKTATAHDGTVNENNVTKNDLTGIDWTPLPLIPTKINSAVALIQKIPVEISCKALDATAIKKKKEDIEFLKNKPKIEKELQSIASQLSIGEVDLGETKNSLKKYSESPMGLDLSNPEEEDIFSNMIYSLGVETAFEKSLQQFYEVKKAINIRLLETIDHFKFGVSVNIGRMSSMTGLPDVNYEHPANVSTPYSKLPDYSDNTHRIIHESMSVMDMFNKFSNEICDETTLEQLINGTDGYCSCNQRGNVSKSQWGDFKVQLKYIEIKTVDWVGVAKQKGKYQTSYFLTTNEKECVDRIWAQNTYGFWWLANTKKVFGIHKLPFAFRTRGNESFQNFSSNIYKSQEKSAVELSISENKKAQIAEIKLQHTILKSLPRGKYIDLRFLRGALEGLKEESNDYTMGGLITAAFEQNIMIGDTEGFDGKNDGQLKPFSEIKGGLDMTEISGYISVIATASNNISRFTGINEQLTGQSANPEGLVGLQKLLINSGLNALYYCNEAIRIQYQSLFNIWGSLIQQAIEKGGKTKQAIVNIIGADDTSLLDSLNQIPLHNLTIKVDIGQREEERQRYLEQLNFLKSNGVITTADEYMLSSINNPKERYAFLAVKEVKFRKLQERQRQEDYLQSQILMRQQGQNAVAVKQAENEGAVNEIYAKGDVEAQINRLVNQLGLTKSQADAAIKSVLQRERGDQQLNKAIKTIEAKNQTNAQQSLI